MKRFRRGDYARFDATDGRHPSLVVKLIEFIPKTQARTAYYCASVKSVAVMVGVAKTKYLTKMSKGDIVLWKLEH